MAENQIKIEISAGTEELVKALQGADKAAVKFTGNITKSFAPVETAARKTSNSIREGFADAWQSIGKGVAIGNLVANGITSAFSAMGRFVAGSIEAAEKQENALNRLGQALKQTNAFSKEAVSNFAAFASELQRNSTFGDEVVLDQLAIAKSFGLTNEQAKKLVQGAVELSATFGTSLESNVKNLGKTFAGLTGELGESLPMLRTLTAEQLKAGGALDLVLSKFGGSAANELNTYTGQVKSLSNAVGDFQEQLGATITQSPLVQNAVSNLSIIVQELTQKMADARIETSRQDEGFLENSESLDQLQRKYNELKTELIDYEQVIIRNKDKGLLDSIFTTDNVPLAKERVRELGIEVAKLEGQLKKAKEDVAKAKAETPEGTGIKIETEAEKAAAAKLLADKAALNQALLQQQADFDAYVAQLNLQKTTLTNEQRAAEYEALFQAEAQKIEAVRQAEIEKANLIIDADLQRATVEAANQKASLDRQKSFLDKQNKLEQERISQERKEKEVKLQIASNFMAAGLAIAKEGSVAQKALQITQATINTYAGANQVLADQTIPTFLKPALVASTVALGLANVARIAGAKFEQGGIVGGSSWHGDRVPALVNSGEMILNKQQQSELFKVANGEGGGGNVIAAVKELITEVKNMPIVVQANGREIARLVRDENRAGFGVI